MTKENSDKLKEAVKLCIIHSERMLFAWGKINHHFPLSVETYSQLSPEDLSFFDQLIFRFSKMQDSIGGRLFPAILENLGEEIRGLPYIDRLTKLEELAVISSAGDWMLLRETRNIVTHEYPFNTNDIVEGLNLLNKHSRLLLDFWQQAESYIKNRFPN